jgi:hypothetical protein
MTTGPVKSKGTLKLDNWWNTSGKKGSKLMSKLKSGGFKLSRLFSADGEIQGQQRKSLDDLPSLSTCLPSQPSKLNY